MSTESSAHARRLRAWFAPEQRPGIRLLAWVSLVSVAGVSITGVWQFFMHESDLGWYQYVAGSGTRGPTTPSSGVAELHSIFGSAVAVTAVFGGAWLAYRVLFDIPWPAVAALVLVVIALVTGSVMRFTLVKVQGRDLGEARRGYWQLFGGDLEFVVTSRFELGPTAIRLWTIGHLLTVPVLVLVIWLGLARVDDDPVS